MSEGSSDESAVVRPDGSVSVIGSISILIHCMTISCVVSTIPACYAACSMTLSPDIPCLSWPIRIPSMVLALCLHVPEVQIQLQVSANKVYCPKQ